MNLRRSLEAIFLAPALGLAVLACGGDVTGTPGPASADAGPEAPLRFQPIASPTQDELASVWVSEDEAVWIASTAGAIYRLDGGVWSSRVAGLPDGTELNRLFGASGRLLGGGRNSVWSFADDTWVREYDVPNCAGWPVGVHIASSGKEYGACSYYSGLARRSSATALPEFLDGEVRADLIWARSDEDVWAFLSVTGETHHFTGGTWTSEASWTTSAIPSAPVRDVWSPDGDLVVAAGATVYRLEGSSWSAADLGGDFEVRSVWGTREDLFAVGDGGHAKHFDGVTWSALATGTEVNLTHVRGSADGGRVVAVGQGGTVLELVRSDPAGAGGP